MNQAGLPEVVTVTLTVVARAAAQSRQHHHDYHHHKQFSYDQHGHIVEKSIGIIITTIISLIVSLTIAVVIASQSRHHQAVSDCDCYDVSCEGAGRRLLLPGTACGVWRVHGTAAGTTEVLC